MPLLETITSHCPVEAESAVGELARLEHLRGFDLRFSAPRRSDFVAQMPALFGAFRALGRARGVQLQDVSIRFSGPWSEYGMRYVLETERRRRERSGEPAAVAPADKKEESTEGEDRDDSDWLDNIHEDRDFYDWLGYYNLRRPTEADAPRDEQQVPLEGAGWPCTTECLEAFVDGVVEAAASVAGHAVALRRVEMNCSDEIVRERRYAFARPLARLISGGTVQLPHLEHIKEDRRGMIYGHHDPDPDDRGNPVVEEFRRFAQAVALQCPNLRVWECPEANGIMAGTCCSIERVDYPHPRLLSLSPKMVEMILACNPTRISLTEVELSPDGSQLARFLSLCHQLRLVQSRVVCQQLLDLLAALRTSAPLFVDLAECYALCYKGPLEFEPVPTALRADGLRLGNPALLRGMLLLPMFSELRYISLLIEYDPAELYACLDTLANAAPRSLTRLVLRILPNPYFDQRSAVSVGRVCAGVRKLHLSELCFELRYDVGLWEELLQDQDMMAVLGSLRRWSVFVTYRDKYQYAPPTDLRMCAFSRKTGLRFVTVRFSAARYVTLERPVTGYIFGDVACRLWDVSPQASPAESK
eukprot:m51a1_g14157 hypothetical protein (587) ;mRNA; r:46788-48548